MIQKKILLTSLALLFLLAGCAQNKDNIMDNLKQADALELAIADNITEYKENPYYTIQVNKQNCRVLVRVNDLPLFHNFFADDGESMHLPINELLPQSGVQTIVVEVYPLSTQETLSDKAHANVKIIYAPDRGTPMNEVNVLTELNLPEALGDQNLAVYPVLGSFEAHVPFDFSKELKNAKDLSKVEDIEKKILNKYQELSSMIYNFDALSFVKAHEHSYTRAWSHNYFTKNDVASGSISSVDAFNVNYIAREMAAFENYEIVYHHNNRVVVLRDKSWKFSLLNVSYWENEEDQQRGESGGYDKDDNGYFSALYMPEGSDELVVW